MAVRIKSGQGASSSRQLIAWGPNSESMCQ